MSNKRGKKKAFVIMPFDAEAQPVHDEFIRPILTDLGFDVFRSDDLLHQQNILRDIVTSIASADLIVADLTDSNPNVYYELGLAHALCKPVILLGQDMEDIPFDIRSYRVIKYDTHFARIGEAKEELHKCVDKFLAGDMIFGNPVSDFLGLEVEERPRPISVPATERGKARTTDDRGLIDHVEDLESSYGELVDILEQLTKRTQLIGNLTDRTAIKIKEGSAQGGTAGRNRVRKVARSFANELEGFRTFMAEANQRYKAAAGKVENSLEFVIEFAGLTADSDATEARERLDSELATLRELLDTTRGGREAFESLSMTMNEVPPLERHLSRAIASAAQEVRKMADNIGQTEAAISRGIRVGERVQSELRERLSNGHEA